MYTLYILYSQTLDKFYVGYTNDPFRRLSEHNRIEGKFTDRGIPWEIVYTEKYASKLEAMKREKYIKAQKSRSYIENLCRSAG